MLQRDTPITPLATVKTGLQRLGQQTRQATMQTGRWLWQQPGIQWATDQYIKAGERELTARYALSERLGTGWKHGLNFGHQQFMAVSLAIPDENTLLKPVKRQTHRWGLQLKRGADHLGDKALWRKIIGSFTFKGITDGIYFLGGGKALLVGLHFVPGPGQLIAPFTVLSALSLGAMTAPALKKARHQFADISPTQLKQMQQRIAHATQHHLAHV
jgi:hypothetical protein